MLYKHSLNKVGILRNFTSFFMTEKDKSKPLQQKPLTDWIGVGGVNNITEVKINVQINDI